MLHRYRTAMVRPGRERLRGTVEAGETFLGAGHDRLLHLAWLHHHDIGLRKRPEHSLAPRRGGGISCKAR